MRAIRRIFVHCSATPPSMDIGADTIRKWHKEGNGWADIGYHKVIRRDGTVEAGRPEEQVGAHAKGHTSDSVAVCMVGGVDKAGKPDANFTLKQWAALASVLEGWLAKYPGATVHGHREVEPGKACPSFDASALI